MRTARTQSGAHGRCVPLRRSDTAHASLALAAVIIASACGGAQKSDDTVPDAEDTPWIRDVDIVGNDRISDDKIIAGLSNQPPQGLIFKDKTRLDPLLLDADRERIEAYYKRQGYFGVEVTDVDLDLVGDDGVRVEFHVREGVPTRMWSVQAEGLPADVEHAGSWRKIRERLEPGQIYDHETYLMAKQQLRAGLNQRGYAHARVEGIVEVDRARRRTEVTFLVDPGPKVTFGDIIINGLEKVPEATILARAPFEPGDTFDPELLETFRGRLYELGFLRIARVSIEREGSPAVADVTVRVEEGFGRELRLGGGVAADDIHWEVRARAGYTEWGFLDPLTVLRLDLRPGYTWLRGETGQRGFGGEARAELERRDIFFPLTTGLARVVYRVIELEGYTSRGPGARLALSRGFFGERLSLGVGWEIHRLAFSSIAPAIDEPLRDELALVDPYRVAYYDQTVSWDQRDAILDPTEGYYLQLRAEEGGAFAGGEFEYVRGTAEARGYVPATARLVLATRARYGRSLHGDLPITQRYFSGGASQHRGFAQRQLAPFADAPETDTVPIGGEAFFESSLELRYDTFEFRENWVGFVPFVDAGDVALTPGEVDFADLHYAVGLGLRYATPVGPLRLDVARRVTNTGEGYPVPGDLWAFHFSLGQAF